VLEDSEVYVKVSLEQGAPFEAGPRSLTLDERKPGCVDVLQPSGVPKVAVRVGSDEREVQVRESISGRIHPSPRTENYDRAEVLLSLRPDEKTFDDTLVCQRRLVCVLSFTVRARHRLAQRLAGSEPSRLGNVLSMRLIVLQFRSLQRSVKPADPD